MGTQNPGMAAALAKAGIATGRLPMTGPPPAVTPMGPQNPMTWPFGPPRKYGR